MKYGPYDPRYPEGKLPDGTDSFTIREDQEQKIQLVMAEPTKGALIADDMGKGKTLMGTEIILRLGLNRVLITGVRDTGKQWAESFKDQSDGRVKLRVMRSDVEGEKNWKAFIDTGEPGIYFAGVEWLKSRDWEVVPELDHNGEPVPVRHKKTGELTGKFKSNTVHLHTYRFLNTKKRHIDMVMFDEVHKMQNRHSNTAHTVNSIKPDWRIGLSGTFMGNSFQGAWKVSRWIWQGLIDASFVRWKGDWCATEIPLRKDGTEMQASTPYGDVSKVVGEKNEGAWVAQLPCYIRDEPDPVPSPRVVKVKLTEPQGAQYFQLQKVSMAMIPSYRLEGGREPMIADIPLTQQQRMRTATLGEMVFDEDMKITFAFDTPSSKFNTMRFIIENIWKDQPVLIGCYDLDFTTISAERLRGLGFGAVAWNGSVTPKRREEIKKGFIASDPEFRYLIATIPSIGTGVDGLQKACSKAIWLEESTSQVDNLQFIKRIFRPGMTTKYGEFEHVKLIAEDTIDEGILLRHDEQSRSMRASLKAA